MQDLARLLLAERVVGRALVSGELAQRAIDQLVTHETGLHGGDRRIAPEDGHVPRHACGRDEAAALDRQEQRADVRHRLLPGELQPMVVGVDARRAGHPAAHAVGLHDPRLGQRAQPGGMLLVGADAYVQVPRDASLELCVEANCPIRAVRIAVELDEGRAPVAAVLVAEAQLAGFAVQPDRSRQAPSAADLEDVCEIGPDVEAQPHAEWFEGVADEADPLREGGADGAVADDRDRVRRDASERRAGQVEGRRAVVLGGNRKGLGCLPSQAQHEAREEAGIGHEEAVVAGRRDVAAAVGDREVRVLDDGDRVVGGRWLHLAQSIGRRSVLPERSHAAHAPLGALEGAPTDEVDHDRQPAQRQPLERQRGDRNRAERADAQDVERVGRRQQVADRLDEQRQHQDRRRHAGEDAVHEAARVDEEVRIAHQQDE